MRPLNQESLEQYIDRYLFDLGYELVDFSLESLGHHHIITCYIDHPSGVITVKDCQEVNNRLCLVLETDQLADIDFRLAVSSPGMDRIVKKPEDFVRFMGRKIKVWFEATEGEKKGRTVEGTLESYQEGQILLVLETGEALEFDQNETKTVRLVPEFDFTPGKVKHRPDEESA